MQVHDEPTVLPRDARQRTDARALRALLLAVAAGLSSGAVGTDIPRTAEGTPDFSGIWQTLSAADSGLEGHGYRADAPPFAGVVEGGLIPYQEWALEKRQANFERRAEADPAKHCFSPGTPRGVYYPEPFQIFQRTRDLTLLFQRGFRARTIHTNESLHPEGPIGFWFGDSRGRWEDDTLVVSVNDFNGQTWLDGAGNFHGEGLRVEERWTLLDRDTLEYRATLEDAEVYTRPWSLRVLLHRHQEESAQLIEHTCYTLEYDDYYPVP